MAKKILVVDDDETIVHLLKETLESEGYLVDAAFDGQAALAQVQRSAPDALIMDVNMPNLSGTQAVLRLRENAATVQLPVVLLTGESSKNITVPDTRTFCLEKPIDL